MTFSTADLAACAERELRMRLRVYPRWVAAGRLTQARADVEIAMMRAIAQRLRAEGGEPTQPGVQADLFGGGR